MTAAASQVAARLDRLPFSRTIWRLVVLVSLGGAFEIYDIFLTAYIAPGLRREGVDPGIFIFCTFMGMLAGCAGFGSIADRLGRRAIFISSLLWYSAATAIMAFQTGVAGIDAWRFIASIGIGLEQVTIDAYLPEFVPPSGRGRAFAFYQFIAFSVVPIVALCGWLLVPRQPMGLAGWRWVCLIGAAGALIAWALRQGLPESPRWLAIHGREAEAERVLEQLEEAVVRDTGAPLPPPMAVARAAAGDAGFREIFRPPYGSRTLLLSIFNLLQTVGFYGFGNWVPTLLAGKGIHLTASLEYAFIIAIANPVGPLLGMLVADRMERKWQIVWAGCGIGVFMLLFAQQTAPALLIALGVLVTLANNWMSFAFHNYQAELFPTRIRSRAVGFVYAWSRVSAAFAGLAIAFFLNTGGPPAVALFIGGAMALMVITIGGFGPRTRNLTLEEISE
jgi:putative MFS transporter